MKGAILASLESLSARSTSVRRSQSIRKIKPEPKHSVEGIWALLWPSACTVAFMASLMIEQQSAIRKRSEAQMLSLGIGDIHHYPRDATAAFHKVVSPRTIRRRRALIT